MKSGISRSRRGRRDERSHPGQCGAWLAAAVLALAAAVTPARAEALDRELLRQAPSIIRQLRESGCRNVGVLKFGVNRGNGPASDETGLMNLDLAARLEVALILADDARDQVGIIHDASAVAATLPGATHLTAEGRKVLLAADYPLAWGDQRVRPDAMLTGVVVLSPDLRRIMVAILAFREQGRTLESIASIEAAADAATLAKSGVNFTTSRSRGVTEASAGPAARSAESPRDSAAPVGLEVYYDGRRVPVQFRDGGAWIPEPRLDQNVELVIRRAAGDQKRYAALLMVNGVNTLFKERFDPLACRKWILGAGDAAIKVSGYQMGKSTAERFRVLPAEESRQNEIKFGVAAGTIDLFVYAERASGGGPTPAIPSFERVPTELAESRQSPAPDLTDEDEDLQAMTRGLPRDRPVNLSALKFQLREGGPSRGLMVEGGEKLNREMRCVSFAIDPQPVLHLTVRYYNPALER